MMTTIETTAVMDLRPRDVDELVDELQAYHAIYSPLFQRREQRYWSAEYLRGLLLEMPRKSIEPMILTLHGADPNAIRAMQQFVAEGAWDDQAILKCHWREVEGGAAFVQKITETCRTFFNDINKWLIGYLQP